MSRIHEALKRAEQERVAAQAAVGSAAAPTEFQRPTATMPQQQVFAPSGHGTGETASTGNGHWDFAQLQMQRQVHDSWKPDANSDVFDSMQSSQGAEQFRTLRSRLYQLRNQHPLRTILITSSIAGEGKTFVVSNLVRSIVRQSERRVLMIDADLRCPRLHTAFGAPAAPGLSDYLRGDADELSIIQHGGEGNLCLIPCGSRISDPSELLSNGRLKTLLDRVGPAFDWVIVDSPPCLPVADAGIIAHWCDGILLVVRAGFSPSAAVLKSKKELKQRNVVGVVLNAVANQTPYAAYYGGYSQPAAKA